MYINAKEANGQSELVIHLVLFLPVNQPGQKKSLEVLYLYFFVQTPVFHIHSQGEQPSIPQGGETQFSRLSTLSLPAALDISHQSRPNRGGVC